MNRAKSAEEKTAFVAKPDDKATQVEKKRLPGGTAWKAMSEQDKGPYVGKAGESKKGYDKAKQAYNKKLNGEDEDSDKSKSEVHDAEDEGSIDGEDDE